MKFLRIQLILACFSEGGFWAFIVTRERECFTPPNIVAGHVCKTAILQFILFGPPSCLNVCHTIQRIWGSQIHCNSRAMSTSDEEKVCIKRHITH